MFGVIFKGFQDGKGNYTSISEIMKRNEKTNAGCPHLTGVTYNSYEECEMGKACDLDCEWAELKRTKEETLFLKSFINSISEMLGIEKPNYTTNKDFADFVSKVENTLQTKERECQYLKRQFEYYKDLFVNSEDKLQVKEQECESQKQRLEYYREKTTQLLNDIDNKDRFNTELQEKIEKLEQELLYAKNIASDILSNNCNIGYARQEVAKILYTR